VRSGSIRQSISSDNIRARRDTAPIDSLSQIPFPGTGNQKENSNSSDNSNGHFSNTDFLETQIQQPLVFGNFSQDGDASDTHRNMDMDGNTTLTDIIDQVPAQVVPYALQALDNIFDLPSNFAIGVTVDTKLMDVKVDQLGTMLGFKPVHEYIPEKLVKFSADCYSSVIEKLMEARKKNDRELEANYWQKFIWLPIVLFSKVDKTTAITNIKKVLDDDWSSFKVGDFPLRQTNYKQQQTSSQHSQQETLEVRNFDKDHLADFTYKDKKIYNTISQGNLSKAMNLLCSTSNPVIPSVEVFLNLQDKFPTDALYGCSPLIREGLLDRDHEEEDALLHSLKNYAIPEDVELTVDPKILRAKISKLKACVKPGIDQLRARHLKQMAGSKPEPNARESRFVQGLCEIISILLRGKEPPGVSRAFRSNELFAGPKPNGDVRPIAMGFTLRKLVATFVLQSAQANFNESHFGTLQFAMQRCGMEDIVHLIALSRETHPELDLFCADGENAFNCANRSTGLDQIKTHFPSAFPHLRNMYLKPSDQWYFGLPDNIKDISGCNGFHQGDVLATWAYIMTIHPLLSHISKTLKEKFPDDYTLVKFFVDDGNFMAPHHVMLEIIKILLDPSTYFKYGYRLKLNKGCILLGHCSPLESQSRKAAFLGLGFRDNIIKPHPNDNPDQPTSEYGAIVLGVPIGHDYVKNVLKDKLEELKQVAMSLCSFPDLQCRNLLFRYCFVSKPTYLFRTVRPDLLKEFADGFDTLQRFFLSTLLKCDRTIIESRFDWMCLRINHGGMGLHKADEVIPAAYTASLLTWMKSDSFKEFAEFHKFTEQKLFDGSSAIFVQFAACLQKFKQDNDNMVALQKVRTAKLGVRESLQSHLNKILELTRIKTLEETIDLKLLSWWVNQKNDMSGQFLQAFPSNEAYTIRSSEFRTYLRYRYLIPQDSVGLVCNCDAKPHLDDFGIHLSSGCNKENLRTGIHDALVLELESSLKHAGFHIKHEERGLFDNLERDKENRPDISINNPNNLGYGDSTQPAVTKIIIDVSVTCALDGAKTGIIKAPDNRQKAKTVGSRVNSRYQEKFNHYHKLLSTINPEINRPEIKIIPFIIQSTGFVHPKSLSLLDRMAEHAATIKKIPGINLFTFYKRRLGCCLVKSIAATINARTHSVSSHASFRYDRSYSDQQIMEIN